MHTTWDSYRAPGSDPAAQLHWTPRAAQCSTSRASEPPSRGERIRAYGSSPLLHLVIGLAWRHPAGGAGGGVRASNCRPGAHHEPVPPRWYPRGQHVIIIMCAVNWYMYYTRYRCSKLCKKWNVCDLEHNRTRSTKQKNIFGGIWYGAHDI